MSNDTTAMEQRIAERINPDAASLITTGSTGALAFHDAAQLMEFAKMMAVAQVAIPKHLRGNPGACLAIALQASEWQMSPFAVANKSYSVNDRIAYEAQLLNAVILRRAPIKGRFKIDYTGEKQSRRCKVSAVLLDGEVVEYESPAFGDITTKNSPLWKSDPDQQLFYFSSRSMCRRHFPDVLLGVYAQEELQDAPPEKDVTPRAIARAEPLDPFKKIEAPAPVVEAEPVESCGLLTDFLNGVKDANSADELDLCRVQCADFEDEAQRAIAKKAVEVQAEALGLKWDDKVSNYRAA